MLLYRIIYYSLAALHVSSDIFAHHQENLNCITASGITHVCRCRLVSWECWNTNYTAIPTARWRSRYRDLLRAGRSRDRIPLRCEIFHTRADRPWNPPILLFKSYLLPFPGGKSARGETLTTYCHLEQRLKKE